MRLFTGIPLPADVVRRLDELTRRLKPLARIKWSPLANLHITTKFIGDWPANRLAELKGALADLPLPGEIRIAVRGLGWFPNERAPRVFWAGVEDPGGLSALARETEARLERLGIARENRKYSPHLTLARIKEPAPLHALLRELAARPAAGFGEFTAAAFHLYQSELRPGGSVYTSLAEFPLGGTGE